MIYIDLHIYIYDTMNERMFYMPFNELLVNIGTATSKGMKYISQ